jgi:hypothetical protein
MSGSGACRRYPARSSYARSTGSSRSAQSGFGPTRSSVEPGEVVQMDACLCIGRLPGEHGSGRQRREAGAAQRGIAMTGRLRRVRTIGAADQPLHVARVRRGGLPLAPARRARVRTRLKENSDPKVLTPLTNAGVGSAIRRWRSHRVCGASRRTQPTTLRCRPGTATVSCLWATAGARRTESERSCAAPERFRLRRDALFSRRP